MINKNLLIIDEPDQLLKVPPPKLAESLNGYLIRLVNENKYEKLKWLYNLIGLQLRPHSVITMSEKSILLLMKITGHEKDKLNELTYLDYGTLVNTISVHNTKICPICFSEDMYHRKYWDISVNIFCASHHCLLINKCSNCNEDLRYNRNKLEECKCGFKLVNLPVIKIDKEIAGLSTIFEQQTRLSNDISFFDNMEYQNSIKLFLLFSRNISLFVNQNELDYSSNTQDPLFLSIILETNLIFLDWPNNFIRFLNLYRLQPKGNRKLGLLRDFGRFYVSIRENFTDEDFNFLISSFEEYVTFHWQSGYKNRIKNNQLKLEETKYLSGAQAANILKVKQDKICKLIQEKLIKGTIKRHKKFRQVNVEIESLMEYQVFINRYVPFQRAKEIIGLSNKSLQLLLNGGIIHSKKFKNMLNVYVLKKDLIALLKYLEDYLDIDSENRGLFVNFKNCLDIAKGYNYSILEIIDFIKRGLLVPRKKVDSEIGLKAYLFLKDEVKAIFLKHKKSIPNIKCLNAKDITELIPCAQGVVQYWINMGYFGKTEKVKNTLVVSYNDVLNFVERFTFLNKIIEDFALIISYKKLFYFLDTCEHNPINLNDGTYSRYLYNRAEVEELINNKIKKGGYLSGN